jgi:hypothetical protein
VLGALVCCTTAAAQEGDALVHRGQYSISYQYNEMRGLATSEGTLNTAPISTRLVDFAATYALNDRWTVNFGLPAISRKAAAPSHNPLKIIPPHPESRFLDDGRFHTYLQDLRLGASYLALSEPFSVEPYIELSFPVSDYPFFAIATPGQHLRKTEIGTTLAYRPPFLRWFFNLQTGYVYLPETLGVNVNTTRVDGEAGYFVTPRISAKLFFSSKHGTGIEAPLTPDQTSEAWYYHDQMLRHNYINAGVGADWTVNDRNMLSFDWIQMVHAQDVFKLRKALNITLSRSFGPAAPQSTNSRRRSRGTTLAD